MNIHFKITSAFATALLSVALSMRAAGQATVVGTITDSQTRLPVSDFAVTAQLADVRLTSKASARGSFEIGGLTPGVWTISTPRSSGYLGWTGPLEIGSNQSEVAPLNISL